MICRHCSEALDDGCTCKPCIHCKRPKHACAEPVDERFPPAARDTFAAHEMTTVWKCPGGQIADLRKTTTAIRPGWNLDRAIWSPQWKGALPECMGELYYLQLERARSQKRPVGASQ